MKMGSSAWPYGPRCSILFPPRNYHSQSIGSALRASPFASFGAFAQKHNPNVVSACGRRLSSIANAPGANILPLRCPSRGLRHAVLDSDHTEYTNTILFPTLLMPPLSVAEMSFVKQIQISALTITVTVVGLYL